MQDNKKVFYVFDGDDWASRIPVARLARERGYNVVLGVIGMHKDAEDFQIYSIEKPRNAFTILQLMRDVFAIVKKENPDIFHTVTLKYAAMSALALLPFPAIRKIYTLAGLGYMFHGQTFKSVVLRFLMKPVLTVLLRRKNTVLILQNPDDLRRMIEGHYVREEQCALIRGSGVDLARFSVGGQKDIPPVVLMPTRLVKEKGVHVFIEAARILKKKGVEARFQIAGGETKHNPRAISAQEMLSMTACGSAEWLGRVSDMPDLLARATLIVYPSYYGEGIPRVLLEACAAGKAIVTTDHTGCREAVLHGINGLLVPIRDAQATAEAIEILLRAPEKRQKMEELARRRAESEFDIHIIAEKTLDVYKY